MKVSKVRLQTDISANYIDLSFKDPSRQNPYNIKTIYGLDADDLLPQRYGPSSTNYYNLNLGSREIVARIELNPDFSAGQSYSDLRDTLYRMIAATRTGAISVEFYDTALLATIYGFITKLEVAHFTQTPEIQVTISCDDPILRGPTEVDVDITGFNPALTTITDDASTAPHGFKFEIEFLADLLIFTIKDGVSDAWEFSIDSTIDRFLTGDILYFSSERDNKYVYRDRSGIITHLADKIAFDSVWPILFPGDNVFTCENNTYLSWQSISYTPVYWGI